MPYPISTIAEVLQISAPSHPGEVEYLLFDSRQLFRPESTLFFAFQTAKQDGHNYIASLYASGVRNFVVSKNILETEYPGANFLKVANTLDALQALAKYHRRQFKLPVVGVTGSNGKTIVKEWLAQLLENDYRLVRSPQSYNSQIGVPISVWQIEASHNFAIFEAGISEPGEMKRLADIIDPNIGIFTNISSVYGAKFKDLKHKVREKLDLFEHCPVIIYCRDDEVIDQEIKKRFPDRERLGWSFSDTYFVGEILPWLPFSDRASQENALHCAALMRYLGYELDVVIKRLRQLKPVPLRMELKTGINGCLIVNDSYDTDLSSLAIGLDFLAQQGTGKKRVVILSDMQEAWRDTASLYKEVAGLLAQKKVSKLIGIGETISAIRAFLPEDLFQKSVFYPSTAAFADAFDPEDFHNEAILVKGMRRFAFERVVRLLERKAHKTALEINLVALGHNLNIYRSLLQPGVKIMCMVKAAGYGSGSVEAARYLEYVGADYLAVAYIDEGVELRKAGIKTPILVLNPEEAGFDSMLRNHLEPEIYSMTLLRALESFVPQNKPLSIHLKLDTGMHRLGFVEDELDEVVQFLQERPHIEVKSIFSHLAGSDAAEHDGFTQYQAEQLLKMYAYLSAGLGMRPLLHLLNTGGISRHPGYHFDMVRLGIGLYGVDGSEAVQQRLMQVSTLKATVSQIKSVQKGETVGYNRIGKAEKDIRIATISIGYADGFSRRLSNGRGSVVIRGQRAPVIGNVCMDMTMVDVTHIPNAREGDEVIVFGKDLPVQEVAQNMETIAYEVLTMVSERVTRICFRE